MLDVFEAAHSPAVHVTLWWLTDIIGLFKTWEAIEQLGAWVGAVNTLLWNIWLALLLPQQKFAHVSKRQRTFCSYWSFPSRRSGGKFTHMKEFKKFCLSYNRCVICVYSVSVCDQCCRLCIPFKVYNKKFRSAIHIIVFDGICQLLTSLRKINHVMLRAHCHT